MLNYNYVLCPHRGKEVYENPRYMSVAQAAHQLLEVIASRNASQTPFKCL